jgi:RHS repeat-associated protein
VDAAGNVVETYEYDPYGRVSVYVGSSATAVSASAYGLPFLWKSVRLDEVTGLLQMRNRYYSVELGRFLTRDPLGVWGDGMNGGNEVGYAGNRPLILGDPSGLQTILLFQINAFINGIRGGWLPEPFPFTGEFGTDGRDAGEQGTSRLSVELRVQTDASGFPGAATGSVSCSPTFRRSTPDSKPEEARATPNGSGPHIAPASHGASTVYSGSGSGTYPFSPVASVTPSIDIEYCIRVYSGTEVGSIPFLGLRVVSYGYDYTVRTDGFPDYEVLVNGGLSGYWESPDVGPGLLNLGGGADKVRHGSGTVFALEPVAQVP